MEAKDNPNNVQVGEILPPNCAQTQGGCAGPGGAPYNGAYPFVWNDDLYDASFGNFKNLSRPNVSLRLCHQQP